MMTLVGMGDNVRALRANELFGGLADDALEPLAAACERVLVPGGETVLHQGDRGDAAYVVVAGRLRATASGDFGELDFGELGPGEVFGEIALLADVPRTASVHAIRDSELLRLSATEFHRIVREQPDTLLRLCSLLATRTAGQLSAPRRESDVRTVTVVPAGTSPTPLGAFCRDLGSALGLMGAVEVVDRARVEGELGVGAADAAPGLAGDGDLMAWLDRVSATGAMVLYAADDNDSAWTRRCIRQADRVLVVGDAAGGPGLSRAEAGSSGRPASGARRELVLLQRGEMPRNTARWLRGRAVAAHHHVGGRRDIARLARHVRGHAVGLVLGGGGARGLAHLGVARAFEELGLPVDSVGGTSIGAILGGAIARGWDAATVLAKARSAFVETRNLVGMTLPSLSLSSSRKITRLLRKPEYFGDLRIEDLWLPFFCVSANLSTSEMVVHDDGPVWLATRASASLPGILPPVHWHGDLLVDGGCVNNLPADVMRARLRGAVVAVDVLPGVDLRVTQPFEPTLSGWSVLWHRMNPWATTLDLPNALEIVMRAKELGGRRAQLATIASRPADIVLTLPTGKCSTFDFRSAEGLVEESYRQAMTELPASPVLAPLLGTSAPSVS